MDKTFNYQNWTFRTGEDGSLTIEPFGVHDSDQVSSKEVFSDKQKTPMQPITIPQQEVYRLIGYCLTGDVQNTEILNSVKQLSQQHTLVGGTSRS